MTSRAELLLFLAARAQLVEKEILPALEAGKVVISDRFIDSSVVYQGAGRGLGVERVEALNDFATASHKPDLTIVLDISVEKGFERVGKRAPEKHGATDRIESSPRAFFEAVRQGYLDLARREPERVKVVDAQRPVEEVQKEVLKYVQDLLER
jgi:dTMP kinase